MKRIVLILVGLLLFQTAQAQLESMYSLYRFNPQVINPSQAGSTKHSEFILINRQQWMGMEGSPQTVSLTGNIKYGVNKGLGFVLINDQAGPVKTATIAGDFAYHIKLSQDWNLSGGVRLGMSSMSVNFSALRLISTVDPMFQGDRSTGMKTNTGWGIKLSKGEDGLFFSIAQPRVLNYDFGSQNGAYKDVAYYYAMAGTKVRLNDVVNLYPSAMARISPDAPTTWDVNLTANIASKFDLGASMRSQDSYGARIGVQVSPKLYMGYVYEVPTSSLSKMASNTHELALRFYVFNKTEK
jgi:type IX secretion system PorP/SprF family membrane protein